MHSDAEGIINAHVQSIQEICSKDYTKAQIDAWAGRNFKPHLWHQIIDRDFVWVVEVDNEVKGFGHFAIMDKENGEVMGLYLAPECCGNGLAKKLVQEFIKTARAHNLKKISLHSTITAKSFYESSGFMQSGSDTTIEMRGVDIPCYPMELQI